MNQKSENPLQHVMMDLQQRQQKLGKQMHEFQLLQQEIETLKQKAPHDISAQKKLAKLANSMEEGELGRLNKKMISCLELLKENMASIVTPLQKNEKIGTVAKPGSTSNRTFI